MERRRSQEAKARRVKAGPGRESEAPDAGLRFAFLAPETAAALRVILGEQADGGLVELNAVAGVHKLLARNGRSAIAPDDAPVLLENLKQIRRGISVLQSLLLSDRLVGAREWFDSRDAMGHAPRQPTDADLCDYLSRSGPQLKPEEIELFVGTGSLRSHAVVAWVKESRPPLLKRLEEAMSTLDELIASPTWNGRPADQGRAAFVSAVVLALERNGCPRTRSRAGKPSPCEQALRVMLEDLKVDIPGLYVPADLSRLLREAKKARVD